MIYVNIILALEESEPQSLSLYSYSHQSHFDHTGCGLGFVFNFWQIAATGGIAVIDSNMEKADNSKKYYVSLSLIFLVLFNENKEYL